jgi:hypothetical protein
LHRYKPRLMTCNLQFWSSRHIYKHCNVKGKNGAGYSAIIRKVSHFFLTRKLLIMFTRPLIRPHAELGCPTAKPVNICQHTEQAGGWLYGAESNPPSYQGFFKPKRKLTVNWKWLPTSFSIHINKAWKCSTHLPHMPPSWNLINYRKNLQTHLRQNFTPCFSWYSLILSSTSTVFQLNPQVLLTDWNFTSIDHLFRGYSMFRPRHPSWSL